MAKNIKQFARTASSGRFVTRGEAAKTAADRELVKQRSAKTGKFLDGVRVVSKRDRTGLIKLADR